MGMAQGEPERRRMVGGQRVAAEVTLRQLNCFINPSRLTISGAVQDDLIGKTGP
jgi:hypothetical protein